MGKLLKGKGFYRSNASFCGKDLWRHIASPGLLKQFYLQTSNDNKSIHRSQVTFSECTFPSKEQKNPKTLQTKLKVTWTQRGWGKSPPQSGREDELKRKKSVRANVLFFTTKVQRATHLGDLFDVPFPQSQGSSIPENQLHGREMTWLEGSYSSPPATQKG